MVREQLRKQAKPAAAPTGTGEGSERFNPDEYTGKAKLFAEALNHENDLKAENISLRSQLEESAAVRNALIDSLAVDNKRAETAERDLASAQARIAALEQELERRNADAADVDGR